MDIGKALTFMTEDPRWKEKLGIGTGVLVISLALSIALVGVLGFFIVIGYCIRMMQNVRDGVEHPLPEWDQWGEDLTRGFKLFVTHLVWALPIIVLTIPMIIGGILTDSGSDAGEVFGGLILACSLCMVFAYSIFVALAMPGITIAFAENEDIMSGLQVTNIFNWTRANIGQVIIATLVVIAAQSIISTVAFVAGLLLCVIGLIVTMPLGTLVTYLFQHHLYGQIAREHPMSNAVSQSVSA